VAEGETRVYHPNREKASSKAAKATVVLLLLVSAGLVAIVTLGGWSVEQGAQIISVVYVIIYCTMAYFVAARWTRGVLPLAAALAILLGVVAAIAVPGWFDRDKSGYADPTLPAGLLGLLTLIIVPVQLLLIAFAMRAFSQQWNVEVEMTEDEYRNRHGDDGRGGQDYGHPQFQA
jgi:FtsH-binding integral membrane protein